MGPVQRIARLESHDGGPAFFRQQGPDFARREHHVAKARILRLGQGAELATDQMRFLGVALEDHVRTGVIGPIGAVDALEIARLVPFKDVADVERRHDLPVRGRESDLFPRRKRRGDLFRDGKRQRNRPRVELAIVLDDRFVEDAIVDFAIHRAGERAQRAVGNPKNRREVGL